jgi:hypothetical protein
MAIAMIVLVRTLVIFILILVLPILRLPGHALKQRVARIAKTQIH